MPTTRFPGHWTWARGGRHVSRLGVLLVVAGLLAAAVTYSVLPPVVYRLWPLILVALGALGLMRRPGWVRDLDTVLPGTGQMALWPRRAVSWFLIVLGLVLLAFTLNLVDERIAGPALLIGLGAYLLWRRAR
ncbi:MAG: LiaF transmembrane domain-containing protein [Candidatus Dormibacterales bacterium]